MTNLRDNVTPLRTGTSGTATGAMQPAVTPPLAVIALTKAGFGPRPDDITTFEALGATDTARLTAWIDQQLDPDSISDTACDAIIAANNFATLGLTLEEAWSQYVRRRIVDCPTDTSTSNDNGNNAFRPREELERITMLRAVHSERQVLELVCDFWHNHFNMQTSGGVVREMIMYFNNHVIRPNALGNFRTLLGAVVQSPPMLYYSDNFTNSDTGENTSFARQLFDSHTLGVDHYLGTNVLPNEVAVDGNGFPVGYVDADVAEVARCFTGWTIDNTDASCDTGAFIYRDDFHDDDLKFVLGAFIWANQAPLKDGHDVMDRLAAHPATARHICTKLIRRLVADDPPQTLIDSAAALFQAQWQAADQIAQVVRHIVLSAEFRTSWGSKIKRPFDYAASAIRATQTTFTYEYNTADSNDLTGFYHRMGQRLYFQTFFDGYADDAESWLNTSSMFRRWRFANRIVERQRESDDAYYFDVLTQTPTTVRSAEDIVDFWVPRLLGYTLPSATHSVLVNFMATGYNPTYTLPYRTDTAMQERLRSLIALILTTPSNQWR